MGEVGKEKRVWVVHSVFVGLDIKMLISGEQVILIVVKRFLDCINRSFFGKLFKKVRK